MTMAHDFKVVIPARFASTRLPGKPLLDIAGKPLIQHVYQRALESGASDIVIATDDERIREACAAFGASVCMTSAEHPSGTDRIAEVIETLQWSDDTVIVNLQGDEPLMLPELIRQVASDLLEHDQAGITTLCTPIRTAAELLDPHVVKVVLDMNGYAMYFSRAAVPWDREAFSITTETLPENSEHFRHIGLYAYKAGYIRSYNRLGSCYIEKTESLEQLRAMWHGIRVHVTITDHPPGHGVDTPADLDKVRQLLQS